MKYKASLYELSVPIFPTRIIVSINQTYEKVKSLLEKDYNINTDCLDSDVPEHGGGYIFNFRDGNILLRMLNFDGGVKELSYLQHEILHCVFAVCDHAGIFYSKDSEETYTYLTQFITRELYTALKIAK